MGRAARALLLGGLVGAARGALPQDCRGPSCVRESEDTVLLQFGAANKLATTTAKPTVATTATPSQENADEHTYQHTYQPFYKKQDWEYRIFSVPRISGEPLSVFGVPTVLVSDPPEPIEDRTELFSIYNAVPNIYAHLDMAVVDGHMEDTGMPLDKHLEWRELTRSSKRGAQEWSTVLQEDLDEDQTMEEFEQHLEDTIQQVADEKGLDEDKADETQRFKVHLKRWRGFLDNVAVEQSDFWVTILHWDDSGLTDYEPVPRPFRMIAFQGQPTKIYELVARWLQLDPDYTTADMQEVLKMYGDAWAPESLPSFFRFLMDSQIAKGSGGRAGEWPPHWFVDPLQMHHVDERLLVEDHLAIVLKNNEYYDGVVFCRGLFDTAMEKVLLGTAHDALAGPGEDTKGATNSSVWHSKYDVSLPGPMAERWGKGVANLSTLAFPLKRNQRQSLYLPKLCSTDEITCWFQDENSNARKSLATGPEYQTVVKFTVTDKKVFFVIDSSEGVSGAIVTGYKDMEGNLQIAKMQPQNAPSGDELKVQKAPQYGFPTVLSSKHLVVEECNCPVQDHSKKCITDGCLAWCPDHFRLDACSMHNCRTWYAKTYANVSHYCGWLFSEKAQTLCWALDSIVCTQQSCGWGKSFEPVECHDIDPHARTQQATDYSCGYMTWTDDMRTEITKQTDVDHGPEELWWKDGPGCVDKYVDNQKMMPSARRNDGVFMIFFDSLAWLHVDDAGQKRKT